MTPQEKDALALRRALAQRQLDWRTLRDIVTRHLGTGSPIVEKITESSIGWLSGLAQTLSEAAWLRFATTGSLDGSGPLKLSNADLRHLRGGWAFATLRCALDHEG
ncbi:MAG: hypothetical protein JNG84_10820 [Archangium sp.]|nr:hypothetical protein [Archangium sp.]